MDSNPCAELPPEPTRFKRYAHCTNCPQLGLPPRKIGWTGTTWLHVDTEFHWCILPYVATPA